MLRVGTNGFHYKSSMNTQAAREAQPLHKAVSYPGVIVSNNSVPKMKWHDKFVKRRTLTERVNGLKKFVHLLLSPRTIILQLLSWICIFMVTNIPALNDHLQTIGTAVDVRVIVMILSFTVIFSINHSFERRERTLQDIAKFKSNLTTIYYALHSTKNVDIYQDVSMLMEHLVRYMMDSNPLRHRRLHSLQQKECISGFYDIAYRLFDKVQFPGKWPKEAQLNAQIQSMIEMFERICATKDYRTPLSLRVFSAMMIYLFPVLLAPYFVWHALPNPVHPYQGAYFWSWLFFLLFGALLDVKKTLDNIFDGERYEDDIQIHMDEVLDIMKVPTMSSTRSLF